MSHFDPTDVGWRLGRSATPRRVELWSRYDRTTGVYGEQGSGKTLDLHAAALTGRTLNHVLEWVANPVAAEQPAEILQLHPHAARFWDGLLTGALHGSPDTVGNTVTTVQQAMALFFQPAIRARCIPAP